MRQTLTATPIPEVAKLGTESYEIIWNIKHGTLVRDTEIYVENEKAVFETSSSRFALFKTKWLLGLTIVPDNSGVKWIQLYWKLEGITGTKARKLKVQLQTQLWNYTKSRPAYTIETSEEMQLLDIVEDGNQVVEFQPVSSSKWEFTEGYVGKMTYKLKLTITTPTMSREVLMEQFFKNSVAQTIQNQATLVNNSENADVKFLTSDDVEIWAHKAILKAQCPVFATMLNSNFSEKSTGIIRMTDITGKTLKILLHYFYTGELLPSWLDSDTIVEFTYATGKYQMTKVLELLNDMLGRYSGKEVGNLDVKLMNLAGKLNLENAEARLLKRIVTKIGKVKESGEIFKLFGFEEQELSELADVMANEKVGESTILATMDELYGYGTGTNEAEISLENGMIMLAHVQKKKLKRLEENLLKCFAEKAKLVQSAEELFDLFGRGKQMVKRRKI